MTRAVVARAPTRIDFGGGWTDVPPYPERDGGTVCNLAISRYATATVASAGAPGSNTGDDDRLVRAALRRAPGTGLTASVASDFPISAGLGGSSAAGVALAGAIAVLNGAPLPPNALAALSRTTEVEEMGIAGGYQDHYAAAFGGALELDFADGVSVEQIPLSETFRADLARRLVLVYTGESRISADTIVAVRDAYIAGDARVVRALAGMKALAARMADAMRTEDIDALGALVGEHWIHQRALHPSITTPRIQELNALAMRSGAIGTKALGASGGGCVVAVAEQGREDELRGALSGLGEQLSFTVDVSGFDVIAVTNEEHET